MTNKQLGMIALAGAPAMLIGVNIEYFFKQYENSWFTGVWGIVYMTAWMCGLIAFYRMRIVGDGFGKWLIRIMFFTITMANISNVVQLFTPKTNWGWFFYLDLFWPLSHTLMLVLGITALFYKRLDTYSRGVLFIAGLWLPLALITLAILGRTSTAMVLPGIYNAVLWSLMAGIAIRYGNKPQRVYQQGHTAAVA